jgi:Putative DNA-binding domain
MLEINHSKTVVLGTFINSLIQDLGTNRVLLLDHAEFKLFDGIEAASKDVYTYSNGIPSSGEWDMIIANLPLGMPAELDGKRTTYTQKTIKNVLSRLTQNGVLISICVPLLLRNDPKGIRRSLEDSGFSISAILNAPEGLLKPYTNLMTTFLVIKRGVVTEEFVGELIDCDQAELLASNFIANVNGSNLEQGIRVNAGVFDSFPRWKVRQQIQALETEYKEFSTRKLGELLKSINTVKPKTEFVDKPNCIYIHKVGTKPVTSNLAELPPNHSSFYQCECDDDVVDAKYLESFFGSRLGRLIFGALTTGSYIPNITIPSLNDAEVSIPPIKEQKEIVNSISKMKQIRQIIGQFEDELALNPIGSDQTLKQIDVMLDIVGGLADSDKVLSIIRGGESKQTEFKETLTLDVKKQTREKYIELSAIKTVAAFMNSTAGTLLVGVNDSGEVLGVDHEIEKFFKTHDDFLLKFKNMVKERIGGQAYDFIDYRLVKIGQKHVLFVECKQSPIPVYVDENDFYVRTNPATDKLDGPKMVTYITNHFTK